MEKELDKFVHKNAVNFSEKVRKDVKKRFNTMTAAQKLALAKAAKSIPSGISTYFKRMVENAVSKPRNDKNDTEKFKLKEHVNKLLNYLTDALQNKLSISEFELVLKDVVDNDDSERNENSESEGGLVNTAVLDSESENDSDAASDTGDDDSDDDDSDDDELDNHHRSSGIPGKRDAFAIKKEQVDVDNKDGEMVDRDEVDNGMDMDSLMEKQAEIATDTKAKEMSSNERKAAEKNGANLSVSPAPESNNPTT